MPFLKFFKDPRSKHLDQKTKKNGPRHAVFTIRGDKYVGEWKNNLKHGKGTYVSRNKLVYEGDWLVGQRHGFGVLSKLKDDGTQVLLYEGDWHHGKPEGVGTKHYVGDAYYEGEVKSGMRHGQGRMWYVNGAFYDGQWADDKRHGVGLYVDAWGESYKGYWQADKKQSENAAVGDRFLRYEGEWWGDRRHGLGQLYHLHSGQAQKGMWRDGVAVRTDMRDIMYRQACLAPTPYPIAQIGPAYAAQAHGKECKQSITDKQAEMKTSPVTGESPPPSISSWPSLSPWF